MIITLTGSNSFMLKAELNNLTTAFIKEHGDLGLEKLDGDETSSERMIEAANSLPFLASKKLVVLRSPGVQKAFTEAIERVISSIPETTDLVIVEPKLDKRSAYFKVLKKQTDYKEFGPVDPYNLSNWLVQYAKNQGGEISRQDATYLAERIGQNQQMLANELDKLMTFNPKVNRQSIDLLTEPSPQSTIFELLDAAFAGNHKKVDNLYKEQRTLKVEPQQIIAMLAWQLHVLALVKTAGERNADEIAKDAGLSPFVVRKTMKIANEVTLSEVKKLVKRALALDVKLKTQSIDADEALQHFLLTIS
jgi:DNA polymerase III subunit delta